MVGPKQTWARDAESGAGDAQGHQETAGDSRPYADTDRNSAAQRRPEANTPIPPPRNLVSDEVWGWNDTAGGRNAPMAPEIPVTKGE